MAEHLAELLCCSAAQSLFATREIDLVLADQNLAGITGVQLLEWVRRHSPKSVRLLMTNAPMQILTGTIGGPGWSLALKGARHYGNPMHARFQGTGVVGGEQWVYDYDGYLVPSWPNGVDQRPAIVGSVIRTIPHSGGSAGSVSPAGVVASFYAVRAS